MTRSEQQAVVVGSESPYSGVMSTTVGYVPNTLRNFVIEGGAMAWLLARILWSAVSRPIGYWGAVLDDMHRTIRQAWFPIVASISGFLIFMAIMVVQSLTMMGAVSVFGPAVFLQSVRSFTVWVNSMVIAGVVGAALTADIGARKVREEIDAMEVMGIDPIRDLAVPRVISVTLMMTIISVPSLIVTSVSMQLGAWYVAKLPPADFYSNIFSNLSVVDLTGMVVNSLLVGLLIGTVCCYKGLSAAGGATGLGRAVNQAVVISFLGVWVLQLGFQALILGLFPEAGDFR